MTTAVFVHRNGPQFASYRYRAEIPAKAIGATVNGGEAHVLIFSKPTPDDVILAKESKADGLNIIFDVGDDHFNHAVWGPIYREMVGLADALVTPTENMGSLQLAVGGWTFFLTLFAFGILTSLVLFGTGRSSKN